jgi:type IV secretion system protein VirD4
METIIAISNTPLNQLIKKIANSGNIKTKTFINNIAEAVKDISDLKMLIGIGQEITNRLRTFATDPIVMDELTPKENQIKLEDSQSQNIFISVPEDRLEQYSGVLTMILTQLIRTLERRPEKHTPEGADFPPVLLMLDEFPRLGKIDVITSAVSTLRSKGVTVAIFCQSLAQLDLIYGEETRRIILNNCPYKAILGATDVASQEYFSEAVGTKIKPIQSISKNYDSDMKVSGYSHQISESRERIIQPHEFATLKDIVLLTPEGWGSIEKMPYYAKTQYFTKTVQQKNNNIIWEARKMLNTDETIKKSIERVEQLENQAKSKEKKENEIKKAIDKNRQRIVGEFFEKYFPEVLQFQPHQTAVENQVEFAPLENFLSALAADKECVARIKEIAAKQTSPDGQQEL